MTAKWPLMDRFWAPELAKQACSRAVNIGDWRCRLLRRMSPLVAPFGPYAMSDLSPNCAPKQTSVDHAELTGSRPGPWPLAFHIPACAFAPDLPVGRRSRCRIQSFCP